MNRVTLQRHGSTPEVHRAATICRALATGQGQLEQRYKDKALDQRQQQQHAEQQKHREQGTQYKGRPHQGSADAARKAAVRHSESIGTDRQQQQQRKAAWTLGSSTIMQNNSDAGGDINHT